MPKYRWAPSALAASVVLGQMAGAVVFGVPGTLFSFTGPSVDGYFAQWAALLGAAAGGGIGILIGMLVLLPVESPGATAQAPKPAPGSWWLIAFGTVGPPG